MSTVAAAKWTCTAEDITDRREVWGKYLDVQQLAEFLGLRPATILDVIGRPATNGDPNSAINRPAAWIGKTALNALPMWSIDQVHRYNELAIERGTAQRVNRESLPRISERQAVQRGLATFTALSRITGRHAGTLYRWRRECPDFPKPVATTRNSSFGPDSVLYRITAVRKFCEGKR